MKTILLYLALAILAAGADNKPTAATPRYDFTTGSASIAILEKQSTNNVSFGGRGNDLWLTVSPGPAPMTASVFIVGACDGAFYPESTKLIVTHEPHVRKLPDGKWEITFKEATP